MKLREVLGYQVGLIGFIRLSILVRLAGRLPTVSLRRVPRLLGIVLGSLVGGPLGLWQSLRQGRRIRATRIEQDPVFIIGHWRSGTTHLHNLMSCDSQFGSLRMFQTLSPDCSLSTEGWLSRLLGKWMPPKRPMDAMDWPMDAPQEEEIALAKMTPYSWYLSFLFPRQAVESFDRFVLFRGVSNRVRREVERTLMRVYRIATLHESGRRLLLKNPVHTCRIPLLLGLFPNAKFIFIHRDPVEVFDSTLNLHRKILELTALQEHDDALIESNVIRLHQLVTATYLEDRVRIPAANLVEIGYADLVEKPEHTLHGIYQSLGLPGFEAAHPAMAAHLAAQARYCRNRFVPDPEAHRRVEQVWAEDYTAFGYARTEAKNGAL